MRYITPLSTGSGTPDDGSVTATKIAAATLVTAADTIASNDNDTTIPTSAAVKDFAESVGGGSGTVDAVVAGTNIDVDATDPANPIVSVETLTLADVSDVTASAAEVNLLDGVTSAVQTQIDAKAPLASPTFTGTVAGVAKSHVGLGNVDNTSNATERAATRTLTNARITKRSLQVSNDTTFDIDTDLYDYAEDTGLTGGVTVTWSGTPTIGQTLWVRLQGTASRAITWDSDFEASDTVALPTTTSGTAALDVGFVWNAATSNLRCVAVA